MTSKENLPKAVVSTISQDVGDSLVHFDHFIGKVKPGYSLSENEVSELCEINRKIRSSLEKVRKMARNNFNKVSVRSDRQGLCYYLINED